MTVSHTRERVDGLGGNEGDDDDEEDDADDDDVTDSDREVPCDDDPAEAAGTADAAPEDQNSARATAAIEAYYAPQFPPPPTDGRAPLAQVANDYLFRCGSEVVGREVSRRGGRAYAYVWDYVWHMSRLFPMFGLPDKCVTTPCHSEELPFVFVKKPAVQL